MSFYLPIEFESDKNLPVIYLTDGLSENNDGITLYDNLLQTNKDLELAAIIVAIGDKIGADRFRDFIPVECGGDANNGHLNFYNFVSQQVVSFVDEHYENNHDDRLLIGYSLGGEFSIDALFRENPNNLIFHNFISIDPSFNCSNSHLESKLMAMKDKFGSLSIDDSFIFFRTRSSIGSGTWFNDFMEAEVNDLPWLDYTYIDMIEDDHQTIVIPSFTEGLKYIYDK